MSESIYYSLETSFPQSPDPIQEQNHYQCDDNVSPPSLSPISFPYQPTKPSQFISENHVFKPSIKPILNTPPIKIKTPYQMETELLTQALVDDINLEVPILNRNKIRPHRQAYVDQYKHGQNLYKFILGLLIIIFIIVISTR